MKRFCFVFLKVASVFWCISSFASESAWTQKIVLDNTILTAIGGAEKVKEKFLKTAKNHEVSDRYPKAVLDEVDEIASSEIDFTGLLDLTHIPFVTIDNDHSKDLDQALAIDFDANKRTYTLYYAIADASYYVRPGTPLDKEASKRLFTTYLPGFDLPVLPRKLSEDLCSLSPGVQRRSLVAIVELDQSGNVLSKDFAQAFINSRAQLSYRTVQEFYDSTVEHSYQHQEFYSSLMNLKELGIQLLNQSAERGVVPFPWGELQVNPEGDTYSMGLYKRYTVEYYNEQISLLTNHLVALFIHEHGYDSLHRFHPPTEERKFAELRWNLAALDYPWPEGMPLKTFMSSINSSEPKGMVAEKLISRVNYKANYHASRRGHFALKLEHYDHFTAPMRRYADIVVHRILVAILTNVENVPYQKSSNIDTSLHMSAKYLKKLAHRLNNASKREKDIEEENNYYMAARLLEPKAGTSVSGTITYINSAGIRVKLQDFPMEIWISTEYLKTFEKFKKFSFDKDELCYQHKKKTISLAQTLDFFIEPMIDSDQLQVVPEFLF